jgi:hypothetical protein
VSIAVRSFAPREAGLIESQSQATHFHLRYQRWVGFVFVFAGYLRTQFRSDHEDWNFDRRAIPIDAHVRMNQPIVTVDVFFITDDRIRFRTRPGLLSNAHVLLALCGEMTGLDKHGETQG